MKLNLFVEQPSIDLLEGIQVTKDTERYFKNDKVEQTLKDLVLESIINDEGSNGINTYSSKVYLRINLNSGDILLFNDEKGYYMPTYPVERIEDAISDINSLHDRINQEVEHEVKEG